MGLYRREATLLPESSPSEATTPCRSEIPKSFPNVSRLNPEKADDSSRAAAGCCLPREGLRRRSPLRDGMLKHIYDRFKSQFVPDIQLACRASSVAFVMIQVALNGK